MLKLTKYLFFVICVFSLNDLYPQSKEQLKKEKEQLEQEIKDTNKKLKKEKKKKNTALNQLKLSNKKINQHLQLLSNLEKSINIQNFNINKIERDIEDIEIKILMKEDELSLSKQVYSKLIYQSHIWNNTYNETYFLISSTDLNQLFKRKQYLKQLTLHRVNQIKKIKIITKELKNTKSELEETKENLQQAKLAKEVFFSEKNSQTETLESEKIRNSEIVSRIKENEQFYRNELLVKQKESKAIEEEIKKIIEEEIRKARAEAENNNTGSPLTPEAMELSANFASNQGLLPWPLEKGIITERYGIQTNKHIAGVETKNNGINFQTDEEQSVRVVFDGTVSRIFLIKGKGKAILVSHGGYFTVYSGLKDVVVKAGEKVISKQKLGTVVTSELQGETELHFEIWKGKETQNPVKWLYKAK
ncbi:MAG: hypothetical protein CMD22_05005 [Flavobacteriales bacterium]|nr:hypothetical protein [Flavobacteriales bacterium]|tara:strand:- start:35569 stop:36822 length:1254 start_codon:yes stop_codon:yes gene_type:complete